MKVGPEGGGVRLKFSGPESGLLSGLLDDLLRDLQPDGLDSADPVRERLFPSAYRAETDAAEAVAFRDLTEMSLRTERIERAEQCLAEVSEHRSAWRGSEVQLDAEGAERWIRVLNDVRLALGTRLGISGDDDHLLSRSDPQLRERARYVWLTALQDLLVQSLMGE